MKHAHARKSLFKQTIIQNKASIIIVVEQKAKKNTVQRYFKNL
jgi:hypothetical protein